MALTRCCLYLMFSCKLIQMTGLIFHWRLCFSSPHASGLFPQMFVSRWDWLWFFPFVLDLMFFENETKLRHDELKGYLGSRLLALWMQQWRGSEWVLVLPQSHGSDHRQYQLFKPQSFLVLGVEHICSARSSAEGPLWGYRLVHAHLLICLQTLSLMFHPCYETIRV